MLTLSTTRCTKGSKLNHNEGGLSIQPVLNEGSKMNHNEGGLLIQPRPSQGVVLNHNEGGLKSAK